MSKNIIQVPYRLDESSKTFFDEHQAQLQEGNIILDLSSVRYFNFSGVRFLLSLIKKCYARPVSIKQASIWLYVPQPKLAALLNLMQFNKITPFTNHLDKEI